MPGKAASMPWPPSYPTSARWGVVITRRLEHDALLRTPQMQTPCRGRPHKAQHGDDFGVSGFVARSRCSKCGPSTPSHKQVSPHHSIHGKNPLRPQLRRQLCRIFAVHRRSIVWVSAYAIDLTGVPDGIRTRVTAVKGRCPRPLDDGDACALRLRIRQAAAMTTGGEAQNQRLNPPSAAGLPTERVAAILRGLHSFNQPDRGKT